MDTRLSNHYHFTKPNDVRALNLMNAAARHTLHVLQDIVLAYGHSDEYSFVFHKSCSLFERRSAKIASTVVSTFTAAYVHLWRDFFSQAPDPRTFFSGLVPSIATSQNESLSIDSTSIAGELTDVLPSEEVRDVTLDLLLLPTFDARCISFPSDPHLRDYLSWRQADCHINNLYNTTFWGLVIKGGMTNVEAENFLQGTLSKDKNEILWSRFGVNYNDEMPIFKKGSIVMREYALVEPSGDSKPSQPLARGDIDLHTTEVGALSKTKQDKIRKARQKAKISVQHIDLIKDDFWSHRPWLLSGQPGKSSASDDG